MSLQLAAQGIAAQGRGNDSVLVHMTPRELKSLHEVAQYYGGSLTVNPTTGLPEAGFLDNLLPTILGFAGAAVGVPTWALGLGIGGFEAMRSGSLAKGLMAGLGAYGGAGIGSALASAGGDVALQGALAQSVAPSADAARSILETGLAPDTAKQLLGTQAMQSGMIPSQAVADVAKLTPVERIGSSLQSLGTPQGRTAVFDALSKGDNLSKLSMLQSLSSASSPPKTTTPMPTSSPTAFIRPYTYNPNTGTYAEQAPVAAGDWGNRSFPSRAYADGGIATFAGGGLTAFADGGGIATFADGGPVDYKTAQDLMWRSMTTGVPTSEFNRYGGYDAVKNVYDAGGGTRSWDDMPTDYLQQAAKTIQSTGVGNWGVLGHLGVPLTDLSGFSKMLDNGVDAKFAQGIISTYGVSPGVNQSQITSTFNRIGLNPSDINPATGEPYVGARKTTVPVKPIQPTTPAPSPAQISSTIKQLQDVASGAAQNAQQQQAAASGVENVYNKLTGGSKAAYDYLMGRGPYPAIPQPSQVQRPYTPAATVAAPAPSTDTTSPFIYNQASGQYTPNPNYGKGGTGTPGAATASTDGTPPAGADTSKLTQPEQMPPWSPGTGRNWRWDYLNNTWVSDVTQPPFGQDQLATGGIADAYAAGGGATDLGDYSDGGRLLRGPGDGVSDSIPAVIGNRRPARLADGEFVVPARIVSELGNGSTEAGAKKLYAMMDRVQNSRRKSMGKRKVAVDSKADKFLPE